TTKDYDIYFSKFLIEAKQELKKQSIAEKKKAIEKAEESKEEKKALSYFSDDEEKDYGNDDLSLYATLLLPFWQTNASVQPLIQQMLKSNDKRLKYNTMLLLLQHEKPFPDSLLTYFAGLEDYRYELLTDLKKKKKADRFPAAFNNHYDLGRSALMSKKTYGQPDTLVYVDRYHSEHAGKKGFIYFYKYKMKKDDLAWKLAVVGLTPEDPEQFEYRDTASNRISYMGLSYFSPGVYNRYDFTGFTETKIEMDEPMEKQLQKELKKLLYSRRKSAKQFYEDSEGRTTVPSFMD
ncbi:MAG TPA: hypothetical protein VN451_09820, partial [Chitinophagaceae bacterium]|nr:hypothetical protein [Chitinophagaceae bacterium]